MNARNQDTGALGNGQWAVKPTFFNNSVDGLPRRLYGSPLLLGEGLGVRVLATQVILQRTCSG